MATENGKLWTVLRQLALEQSAGVTADALATAALVRDPALLRDGETMPEFLERVRRVLREHNLLDGDGDGATLKAQSTAALRAEAAGVGGKDVGRLATGLGLSLAEVTASAEEQAAASVLRSSRGNSAAPRCRPGGGVALATEDMHAILGDAGQESEREQAVEFLLGRRRGGDPAAVLDDKELASLKALARRALDAARVGGWDTRDERRQLSRLALTLHEMLDGRRRPGDELLEQVRRLLASLGE
jgi:hypothetical protein